jgi:hypothetical protein
MNMKIILIILPNTMEYQLEAMARDMRNMQMGMNRKAPTCPVRIYQKLS